MPPLKTSFLAGLAAIVLAGAIPAMAQDYPYQGCRKRPHHADYGCRAYLRDDGYGYGYAPVYPSYAPVYGGPAYGGLPTGGDYVPAYGGGYHRTHHADYGTYFDY